MINYVTFRYLIIQVNNIAFDRYLEGGIESGFKKVQRGVYEKRLFHVKGKRNVRVSQVSSNQLFIFLSLTTTNNNNQFKSQWI